MTSAHNRVEVLHGVNLDALGRRDPEHYGTLTLHELETQIKRFGARARPRGRVLSDQPRGRVRRAPAPAARGRRRARCSTPAPGPTTRWAIRDALEIAGLPAVEVHLSDVEAREEWRRHSVLDGPRARRGLRQGRRRLPRGARAARGGARQRERRRAAERLAALVAEEGLDQLIVGDLVRPGDSSGDAIANTRWLTGFSGTSGARRRRPGRAPLHHRLPLHRARRERGRRRVRAGHRRRRGCCPSSPRACSGRVGFDDAATSVANLAKLEDGARRRGRAGRRRRPGRAPAPPQGRGRARGDRRGRAARRRGLRVGARAAGSPGAPSARSPRAAHARDPRAAAPSPRSRRSSPPGRTARSRTPSPPTARSRPATWSSGTWARIVDGYCSDCTRTFAVGEIGERGARGLRARPRRAAGRRSTRSAPGSAASEADEAARAVIRDGGHGEHFGHGLGHGVGLEVHEAPRLGKRSEDVLEAGDVVTVEPGVYVPGEFGVRIEDLVVGHRGRVPKPSSLGQELRTVELTRRSRWRSRSSPTASTTATGSPTSTRSASPTAAAARRPRAATAARTCAGRATRRAPSRSR